MIPIKCTKFVSSTLFDVLQSLLNHLLDWVLTNLIMQSSDRNSRHLLRVSKNTLEIDEVESIFGLLL
jgi:hypothetical protein